MKNLLRHLTEWRRPLEERPLHLFLDYDGTLSSIAPSPGEARLPYAAREILKDLAKIKDVKVAIISGRALSDLRQMVPVKGLSYVGSHGIEFQVGRAVSRRVPQKYLSVLHSLRSRLKSELKEVTGILWEQKPFSLAVHYRKVSPGSQKKVRQTVQNICRDAIRRGFITILSGKKVVEIMPPGVVDKGEAIVRLRKLWGKHKTLPVFIGDDKTDESAFSVLRGRGLTVKVGSDDRRSQAQYFLHDVEDVRVFLRTLLMMRAR